MTGLPTDVDVAIIGGGPAGLATALSLTHHAHHPTDRVVVLEKASFPRDKICAGGLGARADYLLHHLGVEVDVPSVPVQGLSLRVSAGDITVRSHAPIGRVIRRFEFDAALAQAAKDKGVRLEEGTRVTGLSLDGATKRLETSSGTLRAKVVVGADGVGSLVRRALGLPRATLRAQVVEVDTEPCDRDGPRDIMHFEALDRDVPGYTWDFPTLVDGQEMVCRGAYVLQLDRGLPDARHVLGSHLSRRGLSLGAGQKRYAERTYVKSMPIAGAGVLLVGEAAGVDPLTGEGIPQALAYGELAGRYLAHCLHLGEVGFGDWGQRVRSTFFGKDLGFRERLVPWFYGKHRPWVERFLVERPWFARAGAEFFAGRRVPRSWLLRAGLFGASLVVRAMLSRSK